MKCYKMTHDNTVSNFTETEHLIIHSFLKFLNSVKNTVPKVLLTNTLIFVYLYILTVSVKGHSLSEIDFTSKMNDSSEN